MSHKINRLVTFVALPAVTAAVLGAAATGLASVAHAASGFRTAGGADQTQTSPNQTKRPSTNVVRSGKVYAPSMTAPKSGLSMVEHPGHQGLGGPAMKHPESKIDVSTHSRESMVKPDSN